MLLAGAALVVGGAVAGCDVQESADVERGRALFIENCGTCHALTEARTAATIGPDLDASFGTARADGMDQDTIEGVVEAQIDNPRTVRQDDPEYDRTFMPADIVAGRDAVDVAAYVASVAGVPGIEPPALGGAEQIFAELCSTCHTLAAANATGTVGPDLDEVLPGQKPAQVEESIRDPQAQISSGFDEPSAMPPFDEAQIPEEDLMELVQFLLDNAGQQ
jgi:mono/diheme cytochrome c family protein